MSRPTLDELIVLGGDERLDLDSCGRNRYHLDPRTAAGTLHRGSCTCSQLTRNGRVAAEAALADLERPGFDHADLEARQRHRLLEILVPGGSGHPGVFFAPSGSDLCYLPLLFAAMLRPGTGIRNVVTTSEELGSGSLQAHDGRFYSGRTQRGPVTEGARLGRLIDIESLFLSARDADGSVIDHTAEIEALITERPDDRTLVMNLVIGSKSGIENSIGIIERFRDADVIWTVDLCQMRVRPLLIERLLELGCLLLCTGSKFYEAPPFCGAMLVPDQWIDRVASLDVPSVHGFDRLFTAGDVPRAWPALRSAFADDENIGLRLRWEAALAEMEAFAALPEATTASMIADWNRLVVDRIEVSEHLQLLRHQDRTNDSIVSFRVRDRNRCHLDRAALASLHRLVATSELPEIAPYRRALIGQPVSYENGSFLRLAIGSPDVVAAVETGFDPADDLALIDAIERLAAGLS